MPLFDTTATLYRPEVRLSNTKRPKQTTPILLLPGAVEAGIQENQEAADIALAIGLSSDLGAIGYFAPAASVLYNGCVVHSGKGKWYVVNGEVGVRDESPGMSHVRCFLQKLLAPPDGL